MAEGDEVVCLMKSLWNRLLVMHPPIHNYHLTWSVSPNKQLINYIAITQLKNSTALSETKLAYTRKITRGILQHFQQFGEQIIFCKEIQSFEGKF